MQNKNSVEYVCSVSLKRFLPCVLHSILPKGAVFGRTQKRFFTVVKEVNEINFHEKLLTTMSNV